MDAKELRIGNLISKKYHEYPANTGSYWAENPMVLNDFEGIVQYPNVYKPIPLTPEWLEKFGFEKVKDEFNTIIHRSPKIGWLIFEIEQDGSVGIIDHTRNQVTSLESCKHVHQLQNLYFALTGNELNEKTNH